MTPDLHQCSASHFLVQLCRLRRAAPLAYRLALRLERGQMYSATARIILKTFHGVSVGAYSYGECMIPGQFPAGVTIGRYVSIGPGVQVFLRNHPTDRVSMHPFFYNAALGVVPADNIVTGTLMIGHDAWIGANAIITPGCSHIGIGSVIGAGSVVTHDVEDFAVVAGNPARRLRTRFEPGTISAILDSRWWERPISDLIPEIAMFTGPLDPRARSLRAVSSGPSDSADALIDSAPASSADSRNPSSAPH